MTRFGPPPAGAPVSRAEFQQTLQQVGQVIGALAHRMERAHARLYALDAERALRAAGRTARTPVRFQAKYGEDVAVWEAMDAPLDGLYVEVGAFDGVAASVTYAFDACGWDGLLVEAIPERFEQCRVNRPHARVEHAALLGPGAPPAIDFTVVEDRFGGMLSYAVHDPQHLHSSQGHTKRTLAVPASTLDALLTRHFPGRRVDLAVIDVEGGEPELLKGFSLHRWQARVLLIEDNARGADPRIEHLMADKPYTLGGWVEVSRLYVHNDQPQIKRRLVRNA